MAKEKYPSISKAIVIEQVASRSGVDRSHVVDVLDAYADVMQETLLAGVKFPLKYVGYLSFMTVKAKPAGVRWHGYIKDYIYQLAKPGFYKLNVEPYEKFSEELKKNTLFGDSPTPEETERWVKDTYGEDRELWGRFGKKSVKSDAES